jgi:ferric-dicitrate binding protein FerR (iron transport regulator)
MTTGAVTPRLSAHDDASRSAADAVRNSAEYLRRMRNQRQREAVARVRAELRRRAPARPWGRGDRALLLCAAVALVCAAAALVVSSMGLFA